MVINCMNVFAKGSLPSDPSRVIMAVYRQLCKYDIALTRLINSAHRTDIWLTV